MQLSGRFDQDRRQAITDFRISSGAPTALQGGSSLLQSSNYEHGAFFLGTSRTQNITVNSCVFTTTTTPLSYNDVWFRLMVKIERTVKIRFLPGAVTGLRATQDTQQQAGFKVFTK